VNTISLCKHYFCGPCLKALIHNVKGAIRGTQRNSNHDKLR
jgi:hypothetical protein